jgi:hypothetical protein
MQIAEEQLAHLPFSGTENEPGRARRSKEGNRFAIEKRADGSIATLEAERDRYLSIYLSLSLSLSLA